MFIETCSLQQFRVKSSQYWSGSRGSIHPLAFACNLVLQIAIYIYLSNTSAQQTRNKRHFQSGLYLSDKVEIWDISALEFEAQVPSLFYFHLEIYLHVSLRANRQHNSLNNSIPLSKSCLVSLWLYLLRNLHTSYEAMLLRFMPQLSSDPTVAS